jgi:predicted transcriptional regulator
LESFKSGLAHFNLSRVEIAILAEIMMSNGIIRAELQKSPSLRRWKSQIPAILKKLEKSGWITSEKGDKPKFRLVSKSDFQKVLESIVNRTQEVLMTQKNAVYDLVNTVKSYSGPSSGQSGNDSGFKIHAKTPDFIKTWITQLLQANPGWGVFKSEGLMAVSLTKENISFKLSSAEFEAKEGGKSSFGGVFFVECEDKDSRNQLIERIHQYNEDALKFGYKMERKGYVEGKSRGLVDCEMNSSQSVEKGKITTYTCKLEPETSITGKIITSALTARDTYTLTIWAENEEILQVMNTAIKNLK